MTNYMRVKHNMGGSFTTFKQEKEISLSYQRVKTLPFHKGPAASVCAAASPTCHPLMLG